MDFEGLSTTELLNLLKDKKASSKELVEFYLKKIEELNEKYNVFLFVRSKDELLAEAEKSDKERSAGSDKKLLGVPFSIKDSFMAIGTPTTAGDLYLNETMSEYNATVVQKLLDEGSILLGKVNMDSWGFGSSTENSSYGVTKNPFDESRVAGGSSGGSGASVALNMCAFSIGEDTGGSVRNPAAFCGLYGLKPTYGRISRFGCIAYASSLDTIGILARSAEDTDLVFNILKGKDGNDLTIEENENPISENKRSFAWSKDFIPEGLNEEVKQNYLETIKKYEDLGYKSIEVNFPSLKYCIPTYYITAMSETSTNLSRYHGTRYGEFYTKYSKGEVTGVSSWEDVYKKSRTQGFNKEAKRRVFLGAYVSSEGYADAYYKKAQQIRNLLHDEINKILENVDFVLSPITPKPAPKIGEMTSDPIEMYLEDVYTVTANLTGIPSLAIPSGNTKSGLPIGMQLMGKKFDDEKLIKIAEELRKGDK